MKKNLIITIIIFSVVTTLSLASNVIRWDETPLEQTAWSIPLGIGFLLQAPIMAISIPLISPSSDTNFNPEFYQLMSYVFPFITGLSYSLVYYLILLLSNKIVNNKLKNVTIKS